jgi:hypothetical protein
MITRAIVIPALRRDPFSGRTSRGSTTRKRQTHGASAQWTPAQGRGDGWSFAGNAFRLLAAVTALAIASPAVAQEMTEQQSAERYFDRLDQKKQGFFVLSDMQRIEGKVFVRTDDNKDGQLTLSEYNYGIPDERQDVIDRFTKRFRLADADTNGRVTMEEYMQFCANVVAAADANQDGMVTKEEFVAATAGAGTE